jgi:hypothetical protein
LHCCKHFIALSGYAKDFAPLVLAEPKEEMFQQWPKNFFYSAPLVLVEPKEEIFQKWAIFE